MNVPEGVPEHCPGAESKQAGKAPTCAGCPNQQICSTTTKGSSDGHIALVNEKIQSVKNKILVLSGKGGVGKSTVTTLLSRALAYKYQDKNVGVLDIDICGPSQPRMLGVYNESVHQSGSGWSPVYVEDNLSVMSIGFLISSPEEAIIWRGPKKNGIIRQFLTEVDWGKLDYLILDTPPGTSDEHLSTAAYMAQAGITGALIVTTPQEVALLDVRKEIDFCRKVKINILGVIENMSVFVCPCCSVVSNVFPPYTGGAEEMCKELNVSFLGSLPLDPKIGKCCDEGKNIFEELLDSPIINALTNIVEKVVTKCK